MPLSRGVKFRCYPTVLQAKKLSSWMDCQRYIYNAKVGEYRYFKTFRNKMLSLTGECIPVDQQYSQFKDEDLSPFLYQVPSQVLRNGATRFMIAYRRYACGLAGQPAFRKGYSDFVVGINLARIFLLYSDRLISDFTSVMLHIEAIRN